MNKDIIEVAKIGYLKTEKGLIPCAGFTAQEDIPINLDLIAGSCVALYETFIAPLPDDKQLEIEDNFLGRLEIMLKYRANYLEKIGEE